MKARHVPASANTQGTGKNAFLPPASHYGEDQTYFYFGWENLNGRGIIQRQTRSTILSDILDITPATFTQAWNDRYTLSYKTSVAG